tara:strand:- start:12870 stop:13739 length:870 start_codon:yes stop_codon:yes gene_type:complete
MLHEQIKEQLESKGFCIIPNILTEEEICTAKQMFKEWQSTIANHDEMHSKISPHGIYKYHEVGHQRHAWYLRTRPQVQDVFKYLWETEDLIVSYDGSCYISKSNKQKDNIWTHTDQAPNSKGLQCYQGFIALTNNKERTLVVYEGSHLIHDKYFTDRNIKSSKNWQLIDKVVVKSMSEKKRVLEVPAGSLVLWDSRTFHQNQYGKPETEERIVQYVCYLPKNHIKNTKANRVKRLRYFIEKRTTSHWPCPVHVNGKQPQIYGDKSKLIDYSQLSKPYLENIMEEISKLI